MPLAIDAENLTRRYPGSGSAALDGVWLQVAPGERVLLVGPSGSGKSTLLNLVGGLDRPSSGRLSVGGVDLGSLSEGELSRMRGTVVGTVFQHHFLPPGLSAAEAVAAPLLWTTGAEPADALKAARQQLRSLGLTAEETARPVQHLSGGQRQRVAFARAVAPDPAILLADEPTAQLDATTAERLLDELFRWAAQPGKTLVMASHHHLEGLWDRGAVVRLEAGRIVEE
jgi:putative ABC transport system ATP-binding protein